MVSRKVPDPKESRFRRWLRTRCLRPLLERGILGWLSDDFARHLVQQGYTWLTAEEAFRSVRRYLLHAERVCGVRGVRELTDEAAELYARGAPDGVSRVERRRCVRLLMRFLRDHGLLPPPAAPPPSPSLRIVDEYATFQMDHRGVSTATTRRNRRYVEELFSAEGRVDAGAMEALDAAAIQRFVTRRARSLTPSLRKELCGALRTFLRFLVIGATQVGTSLQRCP